MFCLSSGMMVALLTARPPLGKAPIPGATSARQASINWAPPSTVQDSSRHWPQGSTRALTPPTAATAAGLDATGSRQAQLLRPCSQRASKAASSAPTPVLVNSRNTPRSSLARLASEKFMLPMYRVASASIDF